ncbi:MAG: hypothetical protein JST64_11375, partial [Actinobacteria bacterium]|nr:hypothetical protein [Actinomycetota bacterium]
RERNARRVITGGAAAAVVVVVIAVAALLPGGDADQGPAAGTGGSSSTTATTVLDRLAVRATPSPDAIEVHVEDPVLPTIGTARICVRVRIQPEGPAQAPTAAGQACWTPSDGDATTVAPIVATQVDVGCAATVDRSAGVTPPSGSTDTSSTTGPSSTAGVDVAEITAVSSTDDGCETSSPGDDDRTATTSVSIHRP